MDMNGIPWFSNLCQKFEAMCLEIEETMYQDTVKYMENQAETVSSGVKKFCSGFIQDISPLVYSGHNPLIDVGVCRKAGKLIKKSPPLLPSDSHDNGSTIWGYGPLIDVGFTYHILPFVEEFETNKRHEPISDGRRGDEGRHIGVLKSDEMLPIKEPLASDTEDENSETAHLQTEEKCTYKRNNPGASTCGNEQVDVAMAAMEDMSSDEKSVYRYRCETVDVEEVSGVGGEIEPFDEGGCVMVLPECYAGEQGGKPVSNKKKIWGALYAKVRLKRSVGSIDKLESQQMCTTSGGSFESEWEVV